MKLSLLKYLLALCFCSLYGCTCTVNMAHTEGTAADTIDDTQANTPTVSPTITVPVSVTPGIPSV